ncbi:ribose-phosphate pyrophosphokinase [Duganella sp. S19_KUP01_CR8]|uniref:ribose-phosphate pyrophosphokinase n=1 Tax=Duganella sp. S19_KUP01_CR8 TaxID=3025502 RepID=UPI002FCDAA3B
MNAMLMALPGAESFAGHLREHLGCEAGELLLHQFPDGETCPQLTPAVAGRDVILVAALHQPDHKIMALYLCACVARELGARSVGLVAPYLPYMRQDASFAPGQGVTARHFARLLSGCFDSLVTVDPHLHRFHQLSELYGIATEVVPAAPEIAAWISANVERPVLVGPDEESEQWVGQVAVAVGCPYTVLRKVRSGDREVSVSLPPAGVLADSTPVLVDDIISTARTMIAATLQLKAAGCAPPVCIGVHALFGGAAYAELKAAGAGRIVSCDTVPHASNAIGMGAPMATAVARMLGG